MRLVFLMALVCSAVMVNAQDAGKTAPPKVAKLCGLALGGKTFKLKFGHHGSNHPVKNLLTSQVEITAQNHGFCVDPESLPSSEVEITHVNLNDGTNEGMRSKKVPLFSVQYHPEASPGPHDSHYLFTQFTDMMKEFAKPGSSRG